MNKIRSQNAYKFKPNKTEMKLILNLLELSSANDAALMSNHKDWLAGNQDNVSEWNDMSAHILLFQCTSTKKIN
jgi:hypothetical protein